VLLPHLGSATHATRAAMSRIAAENLVAALEGRRPPNLVNADAWPGRGVGTGAAERP
jgi:lactate dehydrogenase-like 2-hydroxyacid dehydrogenase